MTAGGIEIVDAQVHPVSGAVAVDAADQTLAAMDAAGVHAALLLDGARPDLIGTLVAQHPDRFAGLAIGSPLLQHDGSVDEYVAEIRDTAGLVGLRLPMTHPLDDRRVELLEAGQFDPYLQAAHRHGLPVFALIDRRLELLTSIARRFSNVRFVVDDTALRLPDGAGGRLVFEAIPDIASLAPLDNVAVRITNGPMLSTMPFPFPDVRAHVGRIIEAFGVDRVLWASDFTRCTCIYRESLDLVRLWTELSPTDKAWVLGGTLRRWTGWRRPYS